MNASQGPTADKTAATFLKSLDQGFHAPQQQSVLDAKLLPDGTLNIGHPGEDSARVRLSAYGAGQVSLNANAPTSQSLTKNGQGQDALVYARPGLVEWYDNSESGLRQNFRIEKSPAGPLGGGLWLRLNVSGGFEAVGGPSDGLMLEAPDGSFMSYTGLRAWDATGRELEAQMEGKGSEILISVDDTAAQYPVTVDPVWGVRQIIDGAFVRPDVSGDTIAVTDKTGVLRFFVRGTNLWTESQPLALEGAVVAFDLDGNDLLVLVGSGSTGKAVLFERVDGQWVREQEIASPTGAWASGALSRGLMVLGIGGEASVYNKVGSGWRFVRKFVPTDGDRDYATQVAIHDETVVVACKGTKAYVYRRIDGVWNGFGRVDEAWSYAIYGDQIVAGRISTLSTPTLRIFRYRTDRWVAVKQFTTPEVGYQTVATSGKRLLTFEQSIRFGVENTQAVLYEQTSAGWQRAEAFPCRIERNAWSRSWGALDDHTYAVGTTRSLIIGTLGNLRIEMPTPQRGPWTKPATIRLARPAPEGGMPVRLLSSNPEVLKVPWQVRVPEGASSIDVSIECGYPKDSTQVRLTARAGNSTAVGICQTLQWPRIDVDPIWMPEFAKARVVVERSSWDDDEELVLRIKTSHPYIFSHLDSIVFPKGRYSAGFDLSAQAVARSIDAGLKLVDPYGNVVATKSIYTGPAVKDLEIDTYVVSGRSIHIGVRPITYDVDLEGRTLTAKSHRPGFWPDPTPLTIGSSSYVSFGSAPIVANSRTS